MLGSPLPPTCSHCIGCANIRAGLQRDRWFAVWLLVESWVGTCDCERLRADMEYHFEDLQRSPDPTPAYACSESSTEARGFDSD